MYLGAGIRKNGPGGVAFLTFLAAGSVMAKAQGAATTKPNILFIMGDDIGWKQVGVSTGEFRSERRPTLTASGTRVRSLPLLRHAKLYVRPECLSDGHVSVTDRHDPAATPGEPIVSETRYALGRGVPARSRL